MKAMAFVRFCLYCVGCLALAACQPSLTTPSLVQVDQTAVQETLGARGAQSVTPTFPPDSPVTPPTPELSQTPLVLATGKPASVSAPSTEAVSPTATVPASPAPTAVCDKAAAGFPKIDVTVEDNTLLQPAQAFTKIWRLTNVGTCTWTRQYSIRFSHGDQLGAMLVVAFPGDVPPGESVEIAVDMVAPTLTGTYRGNWKLANADGVWFGIGPTGDSPFWVQIVVNAPPTATVSPTPSPSATPSPTVEPSDTPTPTRTPMVLAGGLVDLHVDERIDLDAAQVDPSSDEDLLYQADANGFHLLIPQASAMLGVYGGSQPALRECLSAGMSAAPIAVESLSMGTYLCYRTTSGLPGWLKLVNTRPEDFTLSIEILTWAVIIE